MPLWVPYLLYCFYLHLPLILPPPFFPPCSYVLNIVLDLIFLRLTGVGLSTKPPRLSSVLVLLFSTNVLNNWTKCCACSLPVGVSKGISKAVSWRVESQELDSASWRDKWMKKIIINGPCMRSDPVWRTCTSCIIHLTQRITSVCLLRWSSTSCAAALAGSTSTTTTTKERCWA